MDMLLIQVGVNALGQPQRDQRRVSGSPIRIGRGTDCDLQLPDPRVAQAHAELSADAGGVSICAREGAVIVNGRAVTAARLAVGDRVELGPYRLDVEAPPAGLVLALAMSLSRPLAPVSGEQIKLMRRQDRGLSRRRLSYLGLLGLLLLCLLIPLAPDLLGYPRVASAQPEPPAHEALVRTVAGRFLQTWNPGPVSQGHQIFGADCGACHQQPFVRVRDEACTGCHEGTGDHVPPDRLTSVAGHAFRDTRCAECHVDHKGTPLAIRAQGPCADCHRDVRRVAAQATSGDVTDFLTGHPDFRISLRDAATPDTVRRVRQATPMPPEMVERSGLKFNHALHLNPGGVRDPDGKRGPTGARDAQGRRTVLDCGSCHQPAEGGRTMAPVSMEAHCQRCHSLAFEPSVTSRQAVHGEEGDIATMLREFYARLVLGDLPGGAHPPPDLPRLRPGAMLTSEDRRQALAVADRKAQQVLRELFETREVCSTCHEVQRQAGGWSVAPVRVSRAWMPQAAFTHAKHTTEKCATCHDVARSKEAADVAMPTLATCRDCHVGAQAVVGKVTSDCATCHGFHGISRQDGPHPHGLGGVDHRQPPNRGAR